jgi:hypothetical protein
MVAVSAIVSKAPPAVVDLVPTARAGWGQSDRNHEQGEEPGGQVDVEYPAPCQLIDKKTAQQRPEDGGKTECGSEQPLISPAFAGGNKVSDHGNDGDDQPSAADPLQSAKGNEPDHILRQSAQGGSDQEDDDC